MTTNPIDQEKLRKAREWASDPRNQGDHHTVAAAEVIMSLPEPAPLTMDKITWSDAEHHLAEAEHPDLGIVVMIHPDEEFEEVGELYSIVCSRDGKIEHFLPHRLTPTGKKQKLVPAEWEGGPFPDRQPDTTEPVEDGAPEPQPGEAWVLDCHEDGTAEAIYTGIGDFPWTSFHPDAPGGKGDIYKSAAPLHRLSPVVEPRILVTEDDYCNAPNGTVVQEDERFPCHQKRMNVWVMAGSEVNSENRDMSGIPRTVIWEQEA